MLIYSVVINDVLLAIGSGRNECDSRPVM